MPIRLLKQNYGSRSFNNCFRGIYSLWSVIPRHLSLTFVLPLRGFKTYDMNKQNFSSNNNGAHIQLPVIRQYNPANTQQPNTFYILCKGLNSGKPLTAPTANCFEIRCINPSHQASLFWICFALWKTRSYDQHLYGSVIPFIRLSNFKAVLSQTCLRIAINEVKLSKLIAALENVNQIERLTDTKLKLLAALKIAIFRDLLK